MSYRLKQHETISDGIKRIVIEQIDTGDRGAGIAKREPG